MKKHIFLLLFFIGLISCNKWDYDKIPDVDCGEHGSFNVETGECDCDGGWSGELCNECLNGEKCINGDCNAQTRECDCEENWTGTSCDTLKIDLCANVECVENASCNSETGECDCNDGWEGDNCTEKNLCFGVDCVENASCNSETGKCECNNGWAGISCDSLMTDLCANVNCVNGNCNESTGECDCIDGWQGDNCDEQDLCYGVTCVNGSCNDSTGVCECNDGWQGDDCSELDLCYGVTCVNGSCIESTGECDCEVGWAGASCDIQINLELEFVEGGTFEMGCTLEQEETGACEDDEYPIHAVTLNSFYIGKYEITNIQYLNFLNAIGAESDGSFLGMQYIYMGNFFLHLDYLAGSFVAVDGTENYPVLFVTWSGAQAYCKWAGGRLPTEAEWEYAARGGNMSLGYIYSGSDNINEVAWSFGDGGSGGSGGHSEVGRKKANELGIHDMSGNMWEWCNDWYSAEYYSISPINDPQGSESGDNRVIRGGGWYSHPDSSQSANRSWQNGTSGGNTIGFRFLKEF